MATYGNLPKKRGFHRHHICPLHHGGEDSADNIVYMSPEQHAKEHEKLFELFGKPQDLAAAQMIRKRIGVSSPYKGLKWWSCTKTGKNTRSLVKPSKSFELGFTASHKNRTTNGRTWYYNKETKEQRMLFEAPDGWFKGRLPGSVNPNKNHVWWYHEVSKKETHKATCPGLGWVRGKLTNFFLNRAQ